MTEHIQHLKNLVETTKKELDELKNSKKFKGRAKLIKDKEFELRIFTDHLIISEVAVR